MGKLLEAGVPMLLRYALDDSNDAVFYVAVHALHSLLVSTLEEVGEQVLRPGKNLEGEMSEFFFFRGGGGDAIAYSYSFHCSPTG